MLTLDRTELLGKIRGSSVGKGGECDVENRHLQGGRRSSHLCQLRIDELSPSSKYRMY
jgi:hypothetical protein